MRRAVIRIETERSAEEVLREMGRGFVSAWRSGEPSDPVTTLTFSSPAQLFAVITPKRWELIERLQTIGPASIRGLARALGRDIRRVHDDVTAMIDWGIVERTDDGKVLVPFDVIHAGFDLRAVA
ncbi:HVO_A0114 family putative DNA-binding protein [Bosea sp. PAMC 26642]|uniref:HVO_A0114 family putative DNA-binding protein n=1 Tax=Bosea sp. (strain PAMC 26642) TaxID=1792307 RepID=UPI00077029D0|nr:transcriptional regulator [Bosea sp. PAMC 26642]AMJ59511.1 transcriptional regulator [Bosea sp. PAMC 26642]